MNVQRFRGGLVFQAHRPCVSLNSRLESNEEEEEAKCGAKATDVHRYMARAIYYEVMLPAAERVLY